MNNTGLQIEILKLAVKDHLRTTCEDFEGRSKFLCIAVNYAAEKLGNAYPAAEAIKYRILRRCAPGLTYYGYLIGNGIIRKSTPFEDIQALRRGLAYDIIQEIMDDETWAEEAYRVVRSFVKGIFK